VRLRRVLRAAKVGEARASTICSQLDERRESNTGREERQLEAGSNERRRVRQRLPNTPLLTGGFDGVRRHAKLERGLVVREHKKFLAICGKVVRGDGIGEVQIFDLLQASQVIDEQMASAVGQAKTLARARDLRTVAQPANQRLAGRNGIKQHTIVVVLDDQPISYGSDRFRKLRPIACVQNRRAHERPAAAIQSFEKIVAFSLSSLPEGSAWRFFKRRRSVSRL
jgi:hypothetical protein